MGRSQPGVGLWSPHFFVLQFFESGLTLNPHNKRHSFGLFISLYLCCVVDCINIYMYSVQSNLDCYRYNVIVVTLFEFFREIWSEHYIGHLQSTQVSGACVHRATLRRQGTCLCHISNFEIVVTV